MKSTKGLFALFLALRFRARDTKAARRSDAARLAADAASCRLPRFNRYWTAQYAGIVDQNGRIACQYEDIDHALAWLAA